MTPDMAQRFQLCFVGPGFYHSRHTDWLEYLCNNSQWRCGMLAVKHGIASFAAILIFFSTVLFIFPEAALVSPISSFLTSVQRIWRPMEGHGLPVRNWTFQADQDARNYALNEEQCLSAFPGLFDDIERSVQGRQGNPITFKELDGAIETLRTYRDYERGGWLRLLIYDSQVATILLPLPIHRGPILRAEHSKS